MVVKIECIMQGKKYIKYLKRGFGRTVHTSIDIEKI